MKDKDSESESDDDWINVLKILHKSFFFRINKIIAFYDNIKLNIHKNIFDLIII